MQAIYIPQISVTPYRAEVNRMTMQMIVKASDGYVIASDRQMVDEQETRTNMQTEKILHLAQQKVLCMAAGDECAIRAANDCMDAARNRRFDADQTETDRLLRELCDARWKQEKGYLEARGTTLREYNRTILVLFYGLTPPLAWRVTIRENSLTYPLVSGFIRGGASGNTAWFFLNRYYRREMSVRDLLPLVVHTLSMGHELERILIDGHQVWSYYNETATLAPISDEDLERYKASSATIDSYLRQQFTEAVRRASG